MSSAGSRANSPPFQLDAGGYDSDYDGDAEQGQRKKRRKDLAVKSIPKPAALATKTVFTEEHGRAERSRVQSHLRSLTAYDRHKMLINEYFLSIPGAGDRFRRDPSRDKRDFDVIRENHQFLWDDEDVADTWEKQLAKKYYDKLFKEYCICDLRRYKENKVGLRWRVEKEVVVGKGQFNCGEQHCSENSHLRTWEVNFAYVEHGQKKNALVKLRLCPDCSYKLNYHHKRKEVTKKTKVKKSKKMKKHKKRKHEDKSEADDSHEDANEEPEESTEKSVKGEASTSAEGTTVNEADIWREPQQPIEEKTREEEFEEYLQDLFM